METSLHRELKRLYGDNDVQIEDQKLVAVLETHCFRTAADLARLIACPLPCRFHTGQLAASLRVPRWTAQRIAYCLRRMGALCEVGKQGNARLYDFVDAKKVA